MQLVIQPADIGHAVDHGRRVAERQIGGEHPLGVSIAERASAIRIGGIKGIQPLRRSHIQGIIDRHDLDLVGDVRLDGPGPPWIQHAGVPVIAMSCQVCGGRHLFRSPGGSLWVGPGHGPVAFSSRVHVGGSSACAHGRVSRHQREDGDADDSQKLKAFAFHRTPRSSGHELVASWSARPGHLAARPGRLSRSARAARAATG